MPYRALLWSVVTVALALVVVAFWIRAVVPMVEGAQRAGQVPGVYPSRPATMDAAGVMKPALPPPTVEQRVVVKEMLVLSFVLICVLLVVGFFGTLREWMKFRGGTGRGKAERTKYVDAWKIAGERMKEANEEGPDEEGSEGPGAGA